MKAPAAMFCGAFLLAVLGLSMRWPSETASTAYGAALAATIALLPVPRYAPRHRAETGERP